MNEQTKQVLRQNVYQPANRVMQTVRDKPYVSMAAFTTVATLGIGMALLMPNNKHRAASALRTKPARGQRETSATATQSSYFDPAPRAISGSHRSFEEFAGQGPGDMVKKGAPYLLGSAVLLTTLYVFGRKNGKTVMAGQES